MILKILTAIIFLFILFSLSFFFAKSGYSNCVIVEDEINFTGEKLKYSAAKFHYTVPVKDCEDYDGQLDHGDGPKKGVVRWVECFSGPDCDESGMF